jgi:hypothetical protein
MYSAADETIEDRSIDAFDGHARPPRQRNDIVESLVTARTYAHTANASGAQRLSDWIQTVDQHSSDERDCQPYERSEYQ